MDASALDLLLTGLMDIGEGVSDLNLTVGKRPQAELHGKLHSLETEPWREALTAKNTLEIIQVILHGNKQAQETLKVEGACDCAYSTACAKRFRANIFRVRGHYSVVLRSLPTEIPTLDGLAVPEVLAEIPLLRTGLVLVTGATGTGKSTTIAALVNEINESRPDHIITLEDPVEFLHPHGCGTINQREFGTDFSSFSVGLKAALRQAPKVIFVGEIRDRETMEIALCAAETGHLVLSSLHTIDAGRTINRIIGMFDADEVRFIRYRFAQVLRYVVAQRLIPRVDAGRVAIFEIMGSSLRIQELIIEGEEAAGCTFYEAIAEGRAKGWQTFDQNLVELFEAGVISEEVARLYASDPSAVGREVDRVHVGKGVETSVIGELEMDHVPNARQVS